MDVTTVGSQGLLRGLALLSLIGNTAIVVTGGAVRVTSSGLGCPTWPTCTQSSLVPTSDLTGHAVIEFSNRMVSVVLAIVVLATLVLAIRLRTEQALAAVIVGGYFGQALLGGVTVLTDLNPWAVGSHFLLSAAMIAAAFALWWRLREADRPPAPLVSVAGRQSMRAIAAFICVTSIAVLAMGVVVTGAGPHAGDFEKGRVRRNGLDIALMSHIHADLVMVLIGATVGAVILSVGVGAGRDMRRAATALLAAELAQGVIGFVQYFTHLPSAMVLLHMLGATIVWLATLLVVARAWRLDVVPLEVEAAKLAVDPSGHSLRHLP